MTEIPSQIKQAAQELNKMSNMEQDVTTYKNTNKQKYHNKTLNGFKLKDHNVTFVSENGITTYELIHNHNKVRIEVGTSMFSKSYPLTMAEILNVLDFYDLLNSLRAINIHYIEQPAVQAFVRNEASDKKNGGVDKEMSLFIPSKNMAGKEKKLGYPGTIRFSAFRVFLHEISHALGNIGNGPDCEPEADRFSYQEADKWLKADIIDFKEQETKKDNETNDFGF